MKEKIAVVLLNLGGPDSLDSVRPYLFNLFYDKAIINLPNPFRWLLAKFISSTRASKSRKIYSAIGGKSPLLELSELQAEALESKLNRESKFQFKAYASMRYWHPFSDEILKEVDLYQPDQVLLVPLYPQFSFSTTGSSIADFTKKLEKYNTKTLCCYYNHPGFINAHVDNLNNIYKQAKLEQEKIKILFSAHGLPKSNIELGDPYQWQIEQTVDLIMKQFPNVSYQLCYQSKVGPKKWLEPNTQDAMMQARDEGYAVIIVPIAFVSEHSETLYELDILFREYAQEINLKGFYRVKALGNSDIFIEALADLCIILLDCQEGNKVFSADRLRNCPKQFCRCINE